MISAYHRPGKLPPPTAPEGSLAYAIQLARQYTSHGSQDAKRKRLCLGYLETDYCVLEAARVPQIKIDWIRGNLSPWSVIWSWVADALEIPETQRVKHEDARHLMQREYRQQRKSALSTTPTTSTNL